MRPATQDIETNRRSRARRKIARQRRRRLVLLALVFVIGAILGWFVFGWLVFPPRHDQAEVNGLNPQAKVEFVALTVESWSVTRDTLAARERLRGLDAGELTTILNELIAARNREGQPEAAARIGEFAASYGLRIAQVVVTATPAPSLTPTLTPLPTETSLAPHFAISTSITGTLRAAVEKWANTRNWNIVPAGEIADVAITVDPGALLLTERVYTVADRFYTLRTGITQSDVRALWQGQSASNGAKTLLVSDETAEALDDVLGKPGASVKRVAPEKLVTQLWSDPAALALVPFDELTPRVIALPLDNQNVLSHDFKLEQYPLVARTWLSGDDKLVQALAQAIHQDVPLTNRDPQKITTVIMTGTTAIGRTSAYKIDLKGDPALPARVVGPVLAAADITHVSNEIPFVDECVPVLNTMTFCSKPSYLATFKLAGVKIVGLTGNHELDYGPQAMLHTLDIYDKEGLKYYGGGRNAQDASKTLFITDHGNKLAFLGANSFGPAYDWATANSPGAQRYDAATVKKEIADARQKADVVFMEHQAEESYEYDPSPNNRLEFHASIDAGADIVTGVQAHHPQGMEFSADGKRLILYGLGNIFFDQMFDEGVRQGIIARHTIYAGRYLQTELLTTMLEDFVQPRWTTPDERVRLLNAVFAASTFK